MSARSLDSYVARAVAASFGVTLLFFLFLMILLDLLNNLGDYLEQIEHARAVAAAQAAAHAADPSQPPPRAVPGLAGFLFRFYLNLTPLSFLTIAPFVTVIGCMFGVSRLMAQNELQPMLFTGRSAMRVLRPALLCGLGSAAVMAGCWQWVMPRVAPHITSARSQLLGSGREIRNIVQEMRTERGGVFLHADRFDPAAQQLLGVRLLRVSGDGRNVLVRADRAQWDREIGDWRLFRVDPRSGVEGPGVIETFERQGHERPQRPIEILGTPDWTPREIRQHAQDDLATDLFAYDELWELHELRPGRRDVSLALHRHITYPLANLILLMLALPFAIHFERGSRIERVLGAIGISVAYLLSDLICQKLGLSGWLHPVAAAWSPTILFGSLGIVMFGSMKT